MNVEEARAARKQIEIRIHNELVAFSQATNLRVTGIHTDALDTTQMEDPPGQWSGVYNVVVEVDLPR